EWLTIDAEVAHSVQEDDRYREKIDANLAVFNFDAALNSKLNTELSYQYVNELYAPIRTTEYEEEYAFREDDYNQGYKIEADYRLPPSWKSTLRFEYSDFMRTNSYIQAAPYVQNLGAANNLQDDKIKTYEVGLISETGRFYSRAFYTHEVTTNHSSPSITVDPTEEATENEDRETNYSPGYKDKRVNVIHLYSRYRVLSKPNYDFNISGRYVWEEEDNKYHNHNSSFGNLITENVFILGLDGGYEAKNSWDFRGSYNLEYHTIDFAVEDAKTVMTEGLLHDLDLNLAYQLTTETSLNIGYNYSIYDLLDYDLSAEGEIYRYYDHDFNKDEISISLETKF
ncbi:MAG: hypothetical protein R6V17_00660, partial [Halanaerobacter sp.]